MDFALTGFAPEMGFRVFAFDGIVGGVRQTGFTVRTDLSLARKHGISLQDLPLLCRGLLEKMGQDERALTFTDAQMFTHSKNCEQQRELARNKRSVRKIAPKRPVARTGFATLHTTA